MVVEAEERAQRCRSASLTSLPVSLISIGPRRDVRASDEDPPTTDIEFQHYARSASESEGRGVSFGGVREEDHAFISSERPEKPGLAERVRKLGVPETYNHEYLAGLLVEDEERSELGEEAPVSARVSRAQIIDASDESIREENKIFDSHNEGFLLTLIPLLNLSTGLATLIRVPFLMHRHGGALFMVPYSILILLVGIPLSYLELALGQFSGAGIYRVWNCLPKFKGLSFSTVGLSFFISIYYNVLSSWTLLYFIYSFNSDVPWRDFCLKQLIVPGCAEDSRRARGDDLSNVLNDERVGEAWTHRNRYHTLLNETGPRLRTVMNDTSLTQLYGAPQQYYFTHVLLKINDGVDLSGLGTPGWGLLACSCAIWIFILIWQLTRSAPLGKSITFACIKAFGPFVLTLILLIFGFTRPGVENGMKYFFTSDWRQLGRSQIWFDAMSQVFFGLGTTTGVLINTSSYRRFNNNCSRDCRLLVLFNYTMTALVGVTAFLYLGAAAEEYGLDLGTTVDKGPGAMVVLISYAVSKMPISIFCSLVLYGLLTVIGVEQLKYFVETIKEFMVEKFPKQWRKWKIGILTGIYLVAFLLSSLFTFDAGIYIFTVIDSYLVSWQCMLIGCLECIAISWIYGGGRWAKDLELMEQKRPSIFWTYMWRFVTPPLLFAVFIFSLVDYVPVRYNGRNISFAVDSSIWVLNVILTSIIPITYFRNTLRERRTVDSQFLQSQERDIDSNSDGQSNSVETRNSDSLAEETRTNINLWGERLSTSYEKNMGFSNAPVIMVRIDPETNIPHGYFIPPGKKVVQAEPSKEVQAAIIRNLRKFGKRKERD